MTSSVVFFQPFLSLRNLHHMHSSVWISGQYRLPHTRHNPRLTQSYSVGLLLKCTMCKSPSLHFTALGRHGESDITQGIVPFALRLCRVIVTEQSRPLCAPCPKATDCIRGSREREGLLCANWIAIAFTTHTKETWLLSNSLFLLRGFRALGLRHKRQNMHVIQ